MKTTINYSLNIFLFVTPGREKLKKTIRFLIAPENAHAKKLNANVLIL